MPGELIHRDQATAALTEHGPADVAWLSPDEHRRWLAHANDLLRRASWEGARDVEVTERMRHTIAAHAALLVAGFEPDTHPYRNVAAIVVHLGTIVSRGPHRGSDGLTRDAPRYLAGQSGHRRDPLVLDWRTLRRETRNPRGGQNVVYHEFAHKLDALDGDPDGIPPLPNPAERELWKQTMGTNYRRLQRRRDALVRPYGGTNPAEYFAVVTELFFTQPVELRSHLPRVYDRLAGFYAQDPAGRIPAVT